MGTKEYEKKRNLSRSGEPAGGARKSGDQPAFVIQKHDASSLHYDFRLEVGGVLVSWAVPKGLSTDPRDKRLAIRTEDHPLDYTDFEGVIPQGEYGGGTVIVWDRGTFENITRKKGRAVGIESALKHGHAVVRLNGEKLTGGYALQRIETGEREQWLIIKVDDEAADARRNPVSTQPRSVVTGRTVAEVAREEGRNSS
ncbi:MAG: DNA polymerase ligase N-terminal domain-containing protein [Halioglobus sp.]|nr:DNA polymerase ligase N-terminal domain-containing protein [Halioglobus sp.]